ncbi:hypothetical protein DM806_03170 [Sphingobium lactosutens]|uniref:hypothetical protein n=1 Tax=Sphingobium lactosutens TaxID=522773 RepID=UPI0015BFC414|nr:hypothetical protein [Sphingobium lactosutens]NWK94681.1 hypothetical protein [Sphingobium lactosutens]
MSHDARLAALGEAIKSVGNDDLRYAIGETLRGLGYIDFADFADANPPAGHIATMETLLSQ